MGSSCTYAWVKQELPMLHNCLCQWSHDVGRYCREVVGKDNKRDAPYWYNERATVSSLVGSAAHIGGLILSEYRERKGKKDGYVDAWLRFSPEEQYVIEAKQCWPSAERSKATSIVEQACWSLDEAVEDVGKNKAHDGKLLGVSFVVPEVKPRKGIQIRSIVREIKACFRRSRQQWDALAWSFPPVCEDLQWKNSFFPGVVLLAQIVTKRGRER
jgi:hypothetical protein